MTHRKPLKEPQKQLIEKIGVFAEKEGMPPAAARIMALLLVADETEWTFEDIYNELGISKSTASAAIQMLQTSGRIEYITKPGDRRRYFKSDIANWFTGFEKKFAFLGQMKLLYQEVLDQRTKDTKEFNRNLAMLISFLEFMGAELPVLIEKFKKKHAK